MAPGPRDLETGCNLLPSELVPSGVVLPKPDMSIDKRHTTNYDVSMIRSFRHRGLKALYDGRTAGRVAPEHVEKLRDVLALLDRGRGLEDMNLPGLRLHALRGDLIPTCDDNDLFHGHGRTTR